MSRVSERKSVESQREKKCRESARGKVSRVGERKGVESQRGERCRESTRGKVLKVNKGKAVRGDERKAVERRRNKRYRGQCKALSVVVFYESKDDGGNDGWGD